MMKKALIIIFVLLLGGLGGFLLARTKVFPLNLAKLSPKEKIERIVDERDQAIVEAVERGDYRCCIEPPCTMCYLETNQWNNYQAGTCACDDLIAQGKKPCPECKKGLCVSEGSVCGVNEK